MVIRRILLTALLLFSFISNVALASTVGQLSTEQAVGLGQTLQDLRELRQDLLQGGQGIVVVAVIPGSQAESKGIKVGDFIVRYGGLPINTNREFVNAVDQMSSTSGNIELVLIRGAIKILVNVGAGKIGTQVMHVESVRNGAELGRGAPIAKPEENAHIFVQLGGGGPVALSPDGRLGLSAQGNTAKLWEIASGKEIRSFTGHTKPIASVAFSPNGRYALTSSDDGSWRLWDVLIGTAIHTVVGHPELIGTQIVFSPDGQQALSGGSDGVKLWDLATGLGLRTMTDLSKYYRSASSVAFSPDGRHALSSGLYIDDGRNRYRLKLWDVATGQLIRMMEGHSVLVTSLAFSPDGQQALSGSFDKSVKLWDIGTGKELISMVGDGHAAFVRSVAFSSDGKLGLAAISQGAALWDLASGKIIRTFATNASAAAVFTRDGRHVLVSSSANDMRLFDVSSGELIRRFKGNSYALNAAAFSPDGARVLSSGLNGLNAWDITTGRRVMRAPHDVGDKSDVRLSSALSPDGRSILSGTYAKTIKLQDAASGQLVRTFTGHTGVVDKVVFSHDGRYALSSGGFTGSMWEGIPSTQYDRAIRLWDIATGQTIRTLTGHESPVTSIALSHDGTQALSASFIGGEGAKHWDLATGAVLRSFPGYVRAVVMSPDGRHALLAGIEGFGFSNLKTVDLATGLDVRLFKGHSGYVNTVAFSADGMLAISGGMDNMAKIWDVATGKEIRTLKGHSSFVTSVGFSANGRLAVTASEDSTTRLWDISTGKELVQMIEFLDGEWLSLTPDGYFTASSPKAADNLNIRKGMAVYGIDQFYDVFYRPDIVEAALAGKDTSSMVALTINNAIKNPPPVIERVDAPASNGGDSAKFTYRIKSNGGGIGDVRVFHNGKLVKSDGVARQIPDALLGKKTTQITGEVLVAQMRTLAVQATKNDALRGAVTSTPKPDIYESSVEIEPVPGENDISVVAFNAQNSIQSVAMTTQFISSKPPAALRLHILAIGVDQYKDKSVSLAFAVKDSQDISARWKAQAANIYGAQNIFVETVSNAQAGRDGILAKINQMAARVKPTDHFVLFIASHGVLLGDQYYMVTSDYDGKLHPSKLIGANEIVDVSKRIKALSQLYILDTCHAGGMGEVVSGLYDARVSVLAKKMGLHIFASASSSEQAIDGFEGNGLFTHTLLTGLNSNKHVDFNLDKKVSLIELGSFSKDQTRKIAKTQNHKQDPLIINFGQDNPVYLLK